MKRLTRLAGSGIGTSALFCRTDEEQDGATKPRNARKNEGSMSTSSKPRPLNASHIYILHDHHSVPPLWKRYGREAKMARR